MPPFATGGDRPGRILVVDDIESNREVLAGILESGGYTVLTASSGPEALSLAVQEQPDVVLLDVMMPDMDGFEVCRRLKGMAETSRIPVVFVTAKASGEEDQVHGLELGGYDYLVKPVSRAVVLARVGVMLRIRRSDEQIRQLSMIDDFTGLYSRKYVLHRLDEEMKRAQRRRIPLVVSMLDLDDFKSYNDTYGHQFGDQVLREVSRILKTSVRAYDSIGRYGGEEFLLIQPETVEHEALSIVRRLQERVGALDFDANAPGPITVAFSAGLASWDFESSPHELIRRADVALYAAKRSGKRRVLLYEELPPEKRALGSAPCEGQLESRRADR